MKQLKCLMPQPQALEKCSYIDCFALFLSPRHQIIDQGLELSLMFLIQTFQNRLLYLIIFMYSFRIDFSYYLVDLFLLPFQLFNQFPQFRPAF